MVNLTIAANGSYTYVVADNSTMDALDAGDIVTDTFNYTVSDGQGETDIATITITITGINDAPTAVADTDTVTANGTVTDTANSAGTLVSDDTDADASSSLYVTKITHTNGNSSEVNYNSTKTSNAATIVGSKGTLTFGSDGSYSYAANLNVTTGPDTFTYTLTDGTSATTATLTINVVVNHFGYIQEGKTLTVANTASLVSGTSTGSNTGDIVFNDTSDTYTVTHIRPGSGSTVSVTDVTYSNGSATSVDGTYGTLTIGSDGSYQYVANSNISGVNAGGSNVTDTFTYTESIGGVATTKTLTIYVIPSQDLTARNDTGNINVGGTLTVSNSSNATSVDTATFSSSDSYSHGLGDSSGVVFNDDGTKVFISDYADRAIYQRNLSTAFDVSSVTGSQTSLFLGSIYPNSLSFNNDGTKLYVLEYNAVKEYALTTAFDVTSGSLSATESLSSQESAMQGLTFNNDGTKMFTVGDSGNRVYEYALSSAFDISSLSYTDNLSIQPQESNPQEIKFNHDGTKMYISGYSGDDINEYTLSSAFDISSTVTHKGVYSVSSSDGSSGAYGFSFNNDGTKLFTTGTLQDRVNEHSLTTPFSLVDVSGEHSGDVINTSSTDNYDTDPDSDTLTVTAIRTGSVEDSGTAGSVGSALTGSYGQLTIAANGSYTYVVADNSTMDALDAGDIVTDTFNYTVSDGQGETDIATITITITGINDAPTAVADTDTVTANGTVTDTTNSAGTLVSDDTDADASSSLYVTKITHTNGNSSEVNYNSTKTSNAATIVGSKGTLTFGSDGSYSYAANLNVTTGPDTFTYTLTDGTSATTATLTINVVVNHFGYIQEGKTLTVANTASLVSGTSTGSNTGDIVFNDTSDTYTVTHIRPGSGSTVSVTDVTYSNGSATSVDGTYGTLTIGSDGSYQYVANSNISGVNAGGSNVTDTFTYTESIGGVATTKTLTIYVIPSQDLTCT
jgi:VCBS repeat-containing protein